MLTKLWLFAAALAPLARAITVNIQNQCADGFPLVQVGPGSEGSTYLPSGGTIQRQLAPGSISEVFKAGAGAQATLAEITVLGVVYYDISIIPTGPKSGPDHCMGLQECKDHTGGVGFNKPMQIVPHNGGCATLTCLADGCQDGYQFPDDVKTHSCGNTDLDVIFCPGGPGKAQPTPSPTPKPTPAPTPAPTPKPTETQTAAPTTPAPTQKPTDTPKPTPSPTPSPSATSTWTPTPSSSSDSDATTPTPSASSSTPTSTSPSTTTPPSSGSQAPAVLSKAELSQITKTAGSLRGADDTTPTDTVEVNNQAAQQAKGGIQWYVVFIFGSAACVAGAAIFVVHRRKQSLEELDLKSPEPRRAASRADALALMVTPKDEDRVTL